MARIFLSYRRDDSEGHSGRLYDRLIQHFGPDNLFRDVDTIDLGVDFIKVIEENVSSCDALLAVIGSQWLDSRDENGDRRLDDPDDFVRLEIETALKRDIRVIPILVHNARMPRRNDLPEALHLLARRNALTVGEQFHRDVDRLIETLEQVLGVDSSSPGLPTERSLVSERDVAEDAESTASPDRTAEREEATPPQDELPAIEAYAAASTPPAEQDSELLASDDSDRTAASESTSQSSATALPSQQDRINAATTESSAPLDDGHPETTSTSSVVARLRSPRNAIITAIVSVLIIVGIVFWYAQKLPQEITNSIGMEFVLIPAGTFTMGSPDSDSDAADDEKPAHQVTISKRFYMGKYEVTQAQWKAVMDKNPSQFKGDDRPVENVSWDDIQEFIKNLNAKEKEASGILCRLPTEAEWEYAARAGSKGRYSFGDYVSQLGDYAWYSENSGGETHPVGQKKPNAWGLYDMHGSVWEWVQDGPRKYSSASVTDPVGPTEAGANRVDRGGGWDGSALFARLAYRYWLRPGYRLGYLGFRCLSSGA